jgi:NTP pyrophosphatase (non-canonical NTP hydrolase)
MTDTSFGNESISRRFEESAQALEQLSEHIRQLSQQADRQTVATDNIVDAATHFAEFASTAQTVAGHMSDANARVAEALDAAETFLNETDLTQVQAEISLMKEETAEIMRMVAESPHAQIQTDIKDIHGQTEMITKVLDESLRAAIDRAVAAEQKTVATEERLHEAQTSLADLNLTHKDQSVHLKHLEDMIQLMPEKVRKKYGF